jgi:hypothetical protein
MFIACWSSELPHLHPSAGRWLENDIHVPLQFTQAWEDTILQGIALYFQVAEGGADEDAEGSRWLCYVFPFCYSVFKSICKIPKKSVRSFYP